ncbi:calcium/sodium antiporter [SAR92 clade bacterium H455]|uniref:Calcium/sodium antiporter n=1 Tax=SAR92 clade bacterium H455 TaxID=2974818 RepID=A0ABY5TP06_9GAMM|nr:calcium/sodium antiporter [SAR92 clade bacterium H455]
MSAMLIPILGLMIGVLGLLWGADRFVEGSAGAARNFGISPLIIGLTVVSIGTSAPEVLVSVNAALSNAAELAVGNALGSNMANIGLVLGVTLLIAPTPVQKHLLTQEGLVLLVITAIAGFCLYDDYLGRVESAILAGLIFPLVYIAIKYKKTHISPEEVAVGEDIPDITMGAAMLWFIIGLAVLLASAEVTVWSAKIIAQSMGVSELIVGLTVVAIGTSLPELAASVVSAMRGHHDIAIGNVFGSNLFNLMLVMPAAGIISPMAISPEVFNRDFISLAIMTLLLIAMVALALNKAARNGLPAVLSRYLGAILIAGYIGYYVVLWPAIVGT